ncbi:MAG: 2-dehydropantoate 2-reductase N-terminal domain-containing protein [Lentimicrobiaceae bacterium]|nr:2-dehydropantoate 2-reductase N-terminal domain-containing protein [Lentimicrobiaceae bacterium]
MPPLSHIVIAGAGTIGTALAQVLADKAHLFITLLSVEAEVVAEINQRHINTAYFPQIRLNERIKATVDPSVLQTAQVVFLAVPSVVVVPYVTQVSSYLKPDAILVNLAKGFGGKQQTIVKELAALIDNPVCTLKGPTFARELIHRIPTAMTVGAEDASVFKQMSELFKQTTIHLDYTYDVTGVEILSILKNIYAITIGIVDAHFDSPNLRFMIFTRAFNEMRNILVKFGGKEETMFRYCGIGDFGLTSLNDLSRNRTLGLLIGKGFFSDDISGKVVLEGRIAADIIGEQLERMKIPVTDYFMLNELNKIFKGSADIKKFIGNILSQDMPYSE